MEKTNNYDLFKKMKGNRDIDFFNLKNIIASIKINNLLQYRPILVTSSMEVIDGQHRLEAAKSLGLEVYYIVHAQANPADMHLINSAQKRWTLEDYVNFHAEQGMEGFKEIQTFCRKHQITTPQLLGVSGKFGGFNILAIKNGRMPIANISEFLTSVAEKIQFIKKVVTFLDEMLLTDKGFLKSQFMQRALSSLANSSSFDQNVFMQKLKINLTRIHACRSVPEYADMFKSFYNYRNNDPLP